MQNSGTTNLKDMTKRGRSSGLNARRNVVLITRYWYWTVIWHRNHESILKTFEEDEFFIKPLTVNLILRNDDQVYKELSQERPGIEELSKRFPSFSWEDNQHNWNK